MLRPEGSEVGAELEKDKQAQRKAEAVTTCVWTQDEFGEDHWDTSCHHRFTFINGCSPLENTMRFCCYCGHQLEEILGVEEHESDEPL